MNFILWNSTPKWVKWGKKGKTRKIRLAAEEQGKQVVKNHPVDLSKLNSSTHFLVLRLFKWTLLSSKNPHKKSSSESLIPRVCCNRFYSRLP